MARANPIYGIPTRSDTTSISDSRDEGSHQGISAGSNDPQLAMVYIAPFLEKWLCGMTWTLLCNKSTLPFLTCDNPVVMWAEIGDGFEFGVGVQDPALRVQFHLTPGMCLAAVQTEESLKGVLDDVPECEPEFSAFCPLRVNTVTLGIGIEQVNKLNQVMVSNAERFVYANTNDEGVRLFLKECFFGLSGPVRRFDRKPIGSPARTEGAI